MQPITVIIYYNVWRCFNKCNHNWELLNFLRYKTRLVFDYVYYVLYVFFFFFYLTLCYMLMFSSGRFSAYLSCRIS